MDGVSAEKDYEKLLFVIARNVQRLGKQRELTQEERIGGTKELFPLGSTRYGHGSSLQNTSGPVEKHRPCAVHDLLRCQITAKLSLATRSDCVLRHFFNRPQVY